jgi:hypothetical protein
LPVAKVSEKKRRFFGISKAGIAFWRLRDEGNLVLRCQQSALLVQRCGAIAWR